MEITLLDPDLRPTRFDRLGIVDFIELRCAHSVSLVPLVCLVCLVDRVCLVYLVYLIHGVCLVSPNKRDKPNGPNNDLVLEVRRILACGWRPLKATWETFSACQGE